jgi:hypothetical protein
LLFFLGTGKNSRAWRAEVQTMFPFFSFDFLNRLALCRSLFQRCSTRNYIMIALCAGLRKDFTVGIFVSFFGFSLEFRVFCGR